MAMAASSAAMAMPAATSAMAMTATTTMMDMSMMSMTFFTATTTALYSDMWMPTTIGAYAGTCIFLILLAVTFRGLLAVKAWREAAWMDAEFKRRYVTVAGKQLKSERMSSDSDSRKMILSENGVEEDVIVVQRKGVDSRPWRFSVDPIRAFMDMIIAGCGYLLMLGVMTMNVGYFLSVLAGTLLGSLAFGRYASQAM